MSVRNSRPRAALLTIVSAILAAALILPAASLAQGSSVDGYGGSGGEVQSSLDSGSGGSANSGGSASGSASASGGSLPFTGLDLGWMIGGGIVLIGAGIAMGRTASRAPQTR